MRPACSSPRRAASAAAVATIALVLAVANGAPAFARGGDPAPAKGPTKDAQANLRASRIPEIPTTISVPLANARSLVVAIPGRLFHQCPRNWSTPTTFEGDGTILQNVWSETTGNSHGMAYLGSIAVPAGPGPFLDRAQAAAARFLEGFEERYARLELVRLVTPPASIRLTKTSVKVDGKPAVAWRTQRFQTALAASGMSNKQNVPLGSECLLLPDEASASLCYLLVDSKGALSLDQLLDGLSLRPTADAHPKGRVVPINDISYGRDGRFPVRLGWYTSPPGFAPTVATSRATDEIVYAEERLDAAGRVTGACRIDHRDRAAVESLDEQAALERSLRGLAADAPARAVDLAPGSGRALVLSFTPKDAARPTVVRVAVFEVDDKIWSFAFTTFGDAALAKADDAALDALLASMNLAVR